MKKEVQEKKEQEEESIGEEVEEEGSICEKGIGRRKYRRKRNRKKEV